MLERLTAIEPARAKREWRFEFPEPVKLPERLLDADRLALGYGERRVLSDIRFAVRSGDRIGILGVNGAGKSTLIKAISGDLAPQAGELLRGQGLAIGYFAQHQLDQLRTDETPLAHLRRLAPEAREQELRDFLGTYRFSGEMATSLIGPMSGGEKARCALALIAWKRPNVLVLDEPTNHLDMETREALTVALSSYEGALILVSHDRHLLRATVNQLWLVHDGRVGPFDGDLDDYTALVLASRRERADTDERSVSTRREQRQQEAARAAAARVGPQAAAEQAREDRGGTGEGQRRAARTRRAARRPGLLSRRRRGRSGEGAEAARRTRAAGRVARSALAEAAGRTGGTGMSAHGRSEALIPPG